MPSMEASTNPIAGAVTVSVVGATACWIVAHTECAPPLDYQCATRCSLNACCQAAPGATTASYGRMVQ